MVHVKQNNSLELLLMYADGAGYNLENKAARVESDSDGMQDKLFNAMRDGAQVIRSLVEIIMSLPAEDRAKLAGVARAQHKALNVIDVSRETVRRAGNAYHLAGDIFEMLNLEGEDYATIQAAVRAGFGGALSGTRAMAVEDETERCVQIIETWVTEHEANQPIAQNIGRNMIKAIRGEK